MWARKLIQIRMQIKICRTSFNWTEQMEFLAFMRCLFFSFISLRITVFYMFLLLLLMLWTHAFEIFVHNYRFIITINLNWFRIAYEAENSLVAICNEFHSFEESGHKSCSTDQFINFRNSISICSHWLCRSA